MGNRSAKEGQDGIPHQAGQCTFVPVDRLDQDVKRPVHDLHHVFGIQIFSHSGRSLYIGKQNGYDAAFPLYLALRSHEALCELFRYQPLETLGHTLGTRERLCGCGWRRRRRPFDFLHTLRGRQIGQAHRVYGALHPSAALKTELGLRGQLCSTLWAGPDQLGATVEAKFGPVRIFVLALRTLHLDLLVY